MCTLEINFLKSVVSVPFEKTNFAAFPWFLEKSKQHFARIRNNTYAEHLNQRRFSTHMNRKQEMYQFFGLQQQPNKAWKMIVL